MKRFFLLTAMFTLLSVFSIHAQRVTGVLSGFKAGINVSSLNSDATEIDEIDARVGFQAAFFVEIPFSRSFSSKHSFRSTGWFKNLGMGTRPKR